MPNEKREEKKSLANKIDFAVIISVKRANPNGDPLNGNRPRLTYDGFGEISDVCLKRKIRDRLQYMNEIIFVQSDDKRAEGDNYRSLKDRYKGNAEIKKLLDAMKLAKSKKSKKAKAADSNTTEASNDNVSVNSDTIRKTACDEWFDVRAFGQVFAFGEKKKDEDGEDSDSVSVGVRGPVTIQSAFSVKPVMQDSLQITKTVNLETNNPPEKKAADTMGMKHRIGKAVYVTYGAINTQLASKTGFTDADAEKIKTALQTLFVNDESSARPAGTMEVLKVIWWKHNSPAGQYSSAKVHRSLTVEPDGKYKLEPLGGLTPEELDGE